jgi:hypothetical protein
MLTTPRRALATLLVLAACSRGDPEARSRLAAREDHHAVATVPDPAHPEAAFELSAEDAARALGSFEWTAAVEWTVAKSGDDAQRVHVTEHHAVRQSSSGDFEVRAEIDPGLGSGSETGKQVIWTGGMTYARALPAAFRERPTDRGRDARRFRDESFRVAASLAGLYGRALRLEPAGESTVLGRSARRYTFALAGDASAASAAAPAPTQGPAPDRDSEQRLSFLRAPVPLSAEGELLVDAATGVPLRIRLAGAFAPKDAAAVRANVELLAQVKALGDKVAAIKAPLAPKTDERKPAGPSTALEAAGLKKRGEKPGGVAEPTDEPE